jgi:hypothetical protein
MNKIIGTMLGGVIGYFLADLGSRWVPEGGQKLVDIGATALGAGLGYIVAPYDAPPLTTTPATPTSLNQTAFS